MEIEQLEIRDYLSRTPPFDGLKEAVLDQVTGELEITYERNGARVLREGEINDYLFLIRKGSVEMTSGRSNTLQGHFSVNEWFGFRSLLNNGKVIHNIKAVEDCLLYQIPGNLFLELYTRYAAIRAYFQGQKFFFNGDENNDAAQHDDVSLVATQIEEMLHRKPLCIPGNTAIIEAARLMTDARATSMLIVDDGELRGIVTDRAFCTKVTATELDTALPVIEIMTPDPYTLPPQALASEALVLMASFNIRHIPVIEGNNIKGTITAIDLLNKQSHNAVYLVNEITRAKNVKQLENLSNQLPTVLHDLIEQSLPTENIGHLISSIGVAFNVQMLKMAEDKLGQAPVDYAWCVAGSLGRSEQTAHSDQDNCLILAKDFQPELHDNYFKELSEYVTRGLDRCGYVFCPGDVMATNTLWRQPVQKWKEYFSTWITTPEPKALMYSSIFFDMRCIYGNKKLLKPLKKFIKKQAPRNDLFIAHIVANALTHRVPLSFLHQFVLHRSGKKEKTLDIKKGGILPLVDLGRIYSLIAGNQRLNTWDRLEATRDDSMISKEGLSDLLDAFEFISSVRLRHQARQIKNGDDPDNLVNPDNLSSFERRHLKNAFSVIGSIQGSLSRKYRIT